MDVNVMHSCCGCTDDPAVTGSIDDCSAEAINHPLVARVYDPICTVVDRPILGAHRTRLASGVSGRILEVGTGTGRLFEAIPEPPPAIEFHALEPDPAMRRRARHRAEQADLDVQLTAGVAEALPYRTNQFDFVLASMVLCTVDNPGLAIQEIARVLRPEGEFRMLEHVRSTDWRAAVQQVATPLWRRLAGGCRLDRPTDVLVDQSAFEAIAVERLPIIVTPVRPFVFGRYRLMQ